MIDTETQKPIKVHVAEGVGSYILFPLDQLPDVQRVLQEHHIKHFLASDAIKIGDRPFIAIIDFRLREDASRIQAALDAV